ncbi:MAG: 4'-phosphopantetheinyl transferase superfamily protein, partial [Gemmatimonadota bacterium]
GKSRDRRFVERVFTFEEAVVIYDAAEPDRAVWTAWAAKEAAFKVVSKLMGDPPPFRHSAFHYSPKRRVTYQGTEIPVRIEERPDRVHVLAWHPRSNDPPPIHSEVKFLPELEHEHDSEWEKGLQSRFSEREWRSVHRPDSALVRLNARSHLARVLGVDETAVEIVCNEGPPGQMPPRVLLEGGEWPGDLSLSHHGRFLAWAFRVPE